MWVRAARARGAPTPPSSPAAARGDVRAQDAHRSENGSAGIASCAGGMRRFGDVRVFKTRASPRRRTPCCALHRIAWCSIALPGISAMRNPCADNCVLRSQCPCVRMYLFVLACVASSCMARVPCSHARPFAPFAHVCQRSPLRCDVCARVACPRASAHFARVLARPFVSFHACPSVHRVFVSV